MESRVLLIIKKWPKFYAHQTLATIYQITKKFAKISGSRYRKKVFMVRNFQSKMILYFYHFSDTQALFMKQFKQNQMGVFDSDRYTHQPWKKRLAPNVFIRYS